MGTAATTGRCGGFAPVVVVAGATGAGKSTVSRWLAGRAGWEHLATSGVLLEAAGSSGVGKADRLASWLVDPVGAAGGRLADPAADRVADVRMLAVCEAPPSAGLVVETAGPVALLQPLDNRVLLVLLVASPRVRAARIAHLLPAGAGAQAASLVVAGKDAATVAAIEAAWGLNVAGWQRWWWRFDLVVGCPDREACGDPSVCEMAVRELVWAAVQVYRCHLVGRTAGQAAAQMRTVAGRWPQWCRRVAPVLTNSAARPAAAEWWRRRLVDELDPQTAGTRPAG